MNLEACGDNIQNENYKDTNVQIQLIYHAITAPSIAKT